MKHGKILKILAICLYLFLLIDSVLYILFGFECIDTLLKLLGTKSVTTVILRWIIVIVAIVILIKRDAIFDYLFRNEDQC